MAVLKAIKSDGESGDTVTGSKPGIWAGLPWMKHTASLALTMFFPAFVMLVSAFGAPLLGAKSFGGLVSISEMAKDPWIFSVLFVCSVVMSIWYWANIRIVQNMHTTVDELKSEVNISIIMALLVAAAGGWMLGKYDSVFWWFIVPGVVQIMDGLGSAVTAINNAAQKDIYQQNRG